MTKAVFGNLIVFGIRFRSIFDVQVYIEHEHCKPFRQKIFRDGAVGACVWFSSPRINNKRSSRSSDHFLLPSDRDGGLGRISHFIWLMGTDAYFIREERGEESKSNPQPFYYIT
jgi:hypothetical protein